MIYFHVQGIIMTDSIDDFEMAFFNGSIGFSKEQTLICRIFVFVQL